MKKDILLFLLAICMQLSAISQNTNSSTDPDANTSAFKEYYPIHIKPSLSYLSNTNSYEDILFDAKPTVYYSFYNNMRANMQNSKNKTSHAAYILFQPHIRMYSENSLPVKTPSYRVLLGWQGLIKTKRNDFFAWAIESGHYSNGQSGCAFGPGLIDESPACEAIHQTITNQSDLSALLNRANGNFSTNITKLSVNYRINNFKKTGTPYKAHSFSASWERYHINMFGLFKKGGYTEFDITIYGKNRYGFEYEYMHTFANTTRFTFGFKTELIQGAHNFVEPFRNELMFTWYPLNRDIGLFASYISGHDNYNYRFVDSGNQVNIGLTWDWFTPFEIKRAEKIKKSL